MIEATNWKIEKARKKPKEVDQQKIKAIAEKQRKDRGKNSSSIKNDDYYDSDISSTNPDQEKGLNPLKNWNDS